MDVKVQTVKNNWSEGMPGGLTYFILGQPKTGKTTAASSWSDKGKEGVLIIDTDLGADFVDGANVVTVTGLNIPKRPVLKGGKQVVEDGTPQTEIVPPKERGYYHRKGKKKGEPLEVYSLSEVYLWLKKEWPKLPYDTIVLDTITQVNGWIEQVVVEELGINAMGEGQWGADWGSARRKNLDLVKKLQTMIKQYGGTLVLIAHSKASAITDGKVQLMPELPRGLGYSLTAKADVIGYTTSNKDDNNYYISFVSYDERAIGSRLKPLSQKNLLFDYETIKKEILTYEEEK